MARLLRRRILRQKPKVYAYKRLPKQQIRLLTLYPGEFDDEISISLSAQLFNKEDPPKYEALSYAWGSRDNPSAIRIKNSKQVLFVTQNLLVALQHMRYVDLPRVLWVDALCIDQSNDVEKGPQVSMMGEIFRCAEQVLLWFGPKDKDSNHAMELLQDLGKKCQVNYRTLQATSPPGVFQMSADGRIMLEFNETDFVSIYNLFLRPFLSRLWVKQEVFLSSNATVYCGSQSMPWAIFRRAWATIFLSDFRSYDVSWDLTNWLHMHQGFVFHPDKGIPLSSLRRYVGHSLCEDPRDRLYGILSLLNKESAKIGISPDYTKTVAEVYEDAVIRHINTLGNLHILNQCRGDSDLDLPSWVPDWSKMSDKEVMSFGASQSSGGIAGIHQITEDNHLRASGVAIGKIQHLHDLGTSSTMESTELIDAIGKMLKDKDPLADYVGGGNVIEACIKSLCINSVTEKYGYAKQGVPNLKKTANLLLEFLSEPENIHSLDTNSWLNFYRVSKACVENRFVFETDNGYMGVAPLVAKPGDEVCVILSCNTPLILRPLENGFYKLLGPCFTAGAVNGEAVLKGLPEGYSDVVAYDERSGSSYTGYLNEKTGQITKIDPRFEALGIDTTFYSPEYLLDVEPETMRRNGINVRDYEIV